MPRRITGTALLLVASRLFAQFDSGQIAGFVKDPSEAVVAQATVIVRNENTGEQHQIRTDESGYYVFPNLVVGTYTVTTEHTGFKKSVQTGITLSSAVRLSIDVTLTVGSVSDTVQVEATAGLVQAESAVVGRTINSKQVADLTLNGRNPIYLALLKPGVRGGSIGTFDPDSVSNGGFSINGGRADEYLVMVDGAVATRTRSSGSMLGSQDVDTIEEVQILTANYSAEYGRSSAGQIRFVTKSGGRDFHGNLVENFRNSALDANTWTRNLSPNTKENSGPAPFRFNQFGYDISGPVFIPESSIRIEANSSFCGHRSGSDGARSRTRQRWSLPWPCDRATSVNCSTRPTSFTTAYGPSPIRKRERHSRAITFRSRG